MTEMTLREGKGEHQALVPLKGEHSGGGTENLNAA